MSFKFLDLQTFISPVLEVSDEKGFHFRNKQVENYKKELLEKILRKNFPRVIPYRFWRFFKDCDVSKQRRTTIAYVSRRILQNAERMNLRSKRKTD